MKERRALGAKSRTGSSSGVLQRKRERKRDKEREREREKLGSYSRGPWWVGCGNDRPPALEANIDECPALLALRTRRAFDPTSYVYTRIPDIANIPAHIQNRTTRRWQKIRSFTFIDWKWCESSSMKIVGRISCCHEKVSSICTARRWSKLVVLKIQKKRESKKEGKAKEDRTRGWKRVDLALLVAVAVVLDGAKRSREKEREEREREERAGGASIYQRRREVGGSMRAIAA